MPGPTIKLTFAGDPKPLERAVDDVGESVGGLGARIKGSTAGLAAAGAGAAAVLSDAFAKSLDMGNVQAELKAAVGDPAKSAEMGKVAGSVYANAYGESLAEVSTAVEAVGASLKGLTTGQLENATQDALNFAKVFKIDVAESTKTVGILISQGLAKDADHGFDMITKAAQKVPAALRGDVLEAVNEYGEIFADLGFTGEQTFGILTSAAQSGGIALDKMGDVIKEMTLKATDGSKSTSDAFKAIGLDMGEMSNKILAGGTQSQEAITSMAKGLLSIQDPSERARQSIALFGTPLEDLGVAKIPEFLNGLANASTSLGDVTGAADTVNATLSDTASNKLEAAKRGFEEWTMSLVAAEGPLGDVATAVVGLGPGILETAGSIGMLLLAFQGLGLWTPIVTAAQWLWNAALTANPIGLIIVAIAALVGAFIYLWNNSEGFRNFFIGMWESIKNAVSNAVTWVGDRFSELMGWFSRVGDSIGKVFSGIGDGIKSVFRGAFNFVADVWNSTIGRISITIPDWVPSIGGKSFTAPKIPRFHQGTERVPGAPGTEMLAMLQAGEKVIPANQADSSGGKVVFGSDGSDFGDALLAVVMDAVRRSGGDPGVLGV